MMFNNEVYKGPSYSIDDKRVCINCEAIIPMKGGTIYMKHGDTIDFGVIQFPRIRWYERICLWFVPKYVSVDAGSKCGDYTATVHYKYFRGKMYITRTDIEQVKECGREDI